MGSRRRLCRLRVCARVCVCVCMVCAQSERPQGKREGERMSESGWRAQRQRGGRARGGACVCVCVYVCVRARVWLGVRRFGELTGEPGPSRGRADSAGCRGQPVLQPRPLNQPAPPDLCSAPGRRQPFPLGRARPGTAGSAGAATGRWVSGEWVAASWDRGEKLLAETYRYRATPRALVASLPHTLFEDFFFFLIPKTAFPYRETPFPATEKYFHTLATSQFSFFHGAPCSPHKHTSRHTHTRGRRLPSQMQTHFLSPVAVVNLSQRYIKLG